MSKEIAVSNNGETTRLPKRKRGETFLVEDTVGMERKRRLVEQENERKFASVKERDHSNKENHSPEAAEENGILQHPDLKTQRHDGIDTDLNPIPALNTEARREYDNELRLQHQNKLQKQHAPDTAPKPRGP